jgi:bacteriocin biosynthesis cyclodehydratase domain-containing protein
VTDAAQEARAAAGSGRLIPEGGLRVTGGRRKRALPRPPRSFRLKRSLELFPASDGSLYLLRSGTQDDFVIERPTTRDQVLLRRLAEGYTSAADLENELEAQGIASDELQGLLDQLIELGLVEVSSPEILSETERARHDRQLIYFSELAGSGESAEDLQRHLSEATIVVLGCGGLGSWAACALACAGVGRLRLVDDDRVELSNLNRQLLFTEQDLGHPKVQCAAEALRAHDSGLRVESICGRVTSSADLAGLLDRADLLIVTADWPPYELARWVNSACFETDVPYISAGQHLPLIRIGPMVVPGKSSCLECLERAARRDFALYDEIAVHRASHPATAATMGASSGMVGALLAMEAIHWLTGAITPATMDRAVILDLRTLRMREEAVIRDPECPGCGSRSSRAVLASSPA